MNGKDSTDTGRFAGLLSAVKAIAIVAAFVVVLAAVLWLINTVQANEVSIGSDKHIEVTPEKILEIKKVGQWEFLSVVDEEVVDTIRHNKILSDDRLTCIYYGTLRLGVDLTRAPRNWAVNHGDTITVTLPAPRLLDQKFIDEARTRVFYESGRWGATAKNQMYRRAASAMRARALTPENLNTVRKAAETRFRDLFLSLGARHVEIKFDSDDLSDFNR